MLTANDVVYGWSPVGGDDDDVVVSQDMRLSGLSLNSFPPSSSSIFSSACPPLNITLPNTYLPSSESRPTSLAPSGISHTSIAPSSDRRAQRNRNRDPTWIPRPRNAFIIFRCEYSRAHSQGSHESQDDDDDDDTNPVTVKTLSKRAAEAWKRLPPSERDRYKVLADKEREEHARLYPHYRFRPMKRQTSGTRRSLEPERSPDPRGPSIERPRPALSAHVPSVLSRSNSSAARGESPPMLQLGAEPLSETLTYPIGPQAEVPSQEDLERAQALEAYTIGLYDHDLLNFRFPFQAIMLDEPL